MQEYEKLSEQALVKKACRGDTKAFAVLYGNIHVELYKFALYTLKHPQDAEDAVSEAIISAYENIGKLRKQESFRSWIFRIVSNCCKKKFSNIVHLEIPETEQADETGSIEESYDVRTAFEMLTQEEKLILAMSIFGGYQSEEIGEMLKQNPATVRSKKSRALCKLRKLLQ